MSNSLAIAAVTSSIRFVLERSLQRPHAGQVGGAGVTTLRPGDLTNSDLAGPAGVNVFCYLATANHAWNLNDLPTRRSDGTPVARPVAAIDLHYLVTCYGSDPELEPQRLLGRVVAAFKETPVLTRDVVSDACALYGANTDTGFLTAADLADEVELVKLSPVTLSLEEMSKLWGVLDSPYLLSLTYLATVVLISGDITPTRALPVRHRVLTVTPSGPPKLAAAVVDPPNAPVTAGVTLLLTGSGLLGPADTEVVIGAARLTPAAGATANELRVVLDGTVRAGVQAVSVRHRTVAGGGGIPPARTTATSNGLPLVVRPSVSVSGVGDDELTLAVDPPLRAGQRASVLLSRLSGGGPATPGEVTAEFPPLAQADEPLAALTIPRAAIPDATWLVRVIVDGVDSLPELVGEVYAAPSVTVPPP